jgi:hypothetical protein
MAPNYSPCWYPGTQNSPVRTQVSQVRQKRQNWTTTAVCSPTPDTSHWLAGCKECADVGIGAVLLESEKFSSSPGTPTAVTAALTRRCDLNFNATMLVFPATRVGWYNRGSMARSFTCGWVDPTGSGVAVTTNSDTMSPVAPSISRLRMTQCYPGSWAMGLTASRSTPTQNIPRSPLVKNLLHGIKRRLCA